MDLVKDLTIVTCIYYDLYGTEFGGRHGPKHKYLYGLLSMLKMNTPVVLYCWEKDISTISNFIHEEGGSDRVAQITFRPYDLYQSPLYEKIKSVKNIEEQKKSDRSFDVSIAKFLMLQHAIQNNVFNSNYFYFLDAGLSSSALFPNKHLPLQDHGMKRWSECSLFTPRLTENLISRGNQYKLLLWKINEWANFIDPKHCADSSRQSIIAGIMGGYKDNVYNYSTEVINEFVKIIDTDNVLYLEEAIMTILYKHNPDHYHTINFDVWYHEDSGDVFQPMRQGKKSFYHTIEELNT